MKLLNRTWPTPAENLACDEALLDACEQGQIQPTLRFWQPAEYFVALGYACHVEAEVDPAACRRLHIPILRRCSGGGTVLQGPGCLNYTLVLPATADSPLQTVTQTNRFIMRRHQLALARLLPRPVQIQGVTDLTCDNRKFSGNAQRRRKNHLLFHGSFLVQLDLPLMEEILRVPHKQPAYRQNRAHASFLTTVPLSADSICNALQEAWAAHDPLETIPTALVDALVKDKYSRPEWNLRR